MRDMKVSVILHHSCIFHVWNSLSIKLLKIFSLECLCDLKSSVSTEVKEDYAVAIFNCSNWLAVLSNDKWRKILVDCTCLFSKSLDSFMCRSKFSTLSKNMSLPTLSYHVPIGIVTVHCNYHSSTRSNFCIKCSVGTEFREEFSKWIEVIESRHFTYVSTIKKSMYSNFLYAFLLCFNNHSL